MKQEPGSFDRISGAEQAALGRIGRRIFEKDAAARIVKGLLTHSRQSRRMFADNEDRDRWREISEAMEAVHHDVGEPGDRWCSTKKRGVFESRTENLPEQVDGFGCAEAASMVALENSSMREHRENGGVRLALIKRRPAFTCEAEIVAALWIAGMLAQKIENQPSGVEMIPDVVRARCRSLENIQTARPCSQMYFRES